MMSLFGVGIGNLIFLKPHLFKKNIINCQISRGLDEKVQVSIDDPDIKSKLNLKLPVAFIIHGWIDKVDHMWVTNIMNGNVS